MISTFKGKRILITGHTGFKGVWLSLMLHELGASVYGYALAPSHNPIYDDIHQSVFKNSWFNDVRDIQKLRDCIRACKPDLVFHMAAQSLVIESYKDPIYTFDVNLMGSLNLLEAIRMEKISCAIVMITTDKVYENREIRYSYNETDALGGYDPYSASKACSELGIQTYQRSFFGNNSANKTEIIAVASARAGNVIGGGDWSTNRIIPDMIRAYSKGQVLEVRNPVAVRPWQHVLDALYGYLHLSEKLLTDPTNLVWQGAWNFGPVGEDNLTVKDVVERASVGWEGSRYRFVEYDPKAVHEAQLLMLDCTKAQNLLNWKPVWRVDRALMETMKWYRQFLVDKESAAELTISQIRQYLREANR